MFRNLLDRHTQPISLLFALPKHKDLVTHLNQRNPIPLVPLLVLLDLRRPVQRVRLRLQIPSALCTSMPKQRLAKIAITVFPNWRPGSIPNDAQSRRGKVRRYL